jgi:hypothetical protein
MHSRVIGVLPVINRLMRRCRLREILGECLPPEDARHRVSTATSILLLVRNVLISREPIDGIAEWAAAFAPELLDLEQHQLRSLNDDGTHITTWNLLRELTERADFLYVADCKLASAERRGGPTRYCE